MYKFKAYLIPGSNGITVTGPELKLENECWIFRFQRGDKVVDLEWGGRQDDVQYAAQYLYQTARARLKEMENA